MFPREPFVCITAAASAAPSAPSLLGWGLGTGVCNLNRNISESQCPQRSLLGFQSLSKGPLYPFPRQRGKKYFKPQKPGTSASAAETLLCVPAYIQGGKETSSWYLTSCKASRKTDLTCWQSYLKRTDKVLLKRRYYPVIHAKLPAD